VSKSLTPSRIFIFSFAGVVLIGTVLLLLPISGAGESVPFIDSLFSSTSAVCVTGLASIDIGSRLTVFGQVTLLILFQIGGLGMITFSALFFGMMGRGLSFKEREIIQSSFLHTPRRDFLYLLRWILGITFLFEGIGTILLFVRFSRQFPFGRALYTSVFHAVSAFNNCGFSLFRNSLVGYQGDWIVNLTLVMLMVVGGIGFLVQFELYSRWRGHIKRLTLHVKLVLIVTPILMIGGALLFYLFEMKNTLIGMPPTTTVLVSLFQSATPRTCGFNTVAIEQLTNPTILLMLVLMFIGASPGSTGGGVKTTSFALMMLIIWNKLKGREEVTVFNRTIPKEVLTRTVAIIIASALVVFIITSVLLMDNPEASNRSAGSRHFFVEYIFESISAFGTVGLSMGATSQLSTFQKTAIILLMFAGRVGPLTLAFAWYSKKKREIVYAEETVMVG